MNTLELQVLQFIAAASSKVNFAGLKRHITKTNPTTTQELKALVAGLVQSEPTVLHLTLWQFLS
jgi:hypothetical protein